MDTCIFCKIIKGELPSNKIYEDNTALVFLDINPVNIGHALVVPKKHFEDIHDTPEETAGHLIKVAQKISTALKKIGAEGINISMNNGSVAGQVVFHLHIHVIPRYSNDSLPMWPARTAKEGELSDVAKKIIAKL